MFDRIHPLWGAALRLKAHREGGNAVATVRQSLRPGKRQETFEKIEEFCVAYMDPATLSEMSMPSEQAIGDGTLLQKIIDFVNLHWADILAIIVKLIGGLAVAGAMSIMGGPEACDTAMPSMNLGEILSRLRALLDLLIPMLPGK